MKAVLLIAVVLVGVYAQKCDWGKLPKTVANAGRCTDCDTKTCKGCQMNNNYILAGNNCCEFNYFADAKDNCALCKSNCLGCTSASAYDCTGCRQNEGFSNIYGPGKCVSPNLSLTIYDKEDEAPYANFNCAAGYKLFLSSNKTPTCVADADYKGNKVTAGECIDGYYFNYEEKQCQECSKELTNAANNCSACSIRGKVGSKVYGCDCCVQEHIPMGPIGECCNHTWYWNKPEKKCAACGNGCHQCYGSKAEDCFACLPGADFVDGKGPGKCTGAAAHMKGKPIKCAPGYTLYNEKICLKGSEHKFMLLKNKKGTVISTQICNNEPSAIVWGCMDKKAKNFNEKATKDDGTCKYDEQCDDSVMKSKFIVFCRDCNFRGDMLVLNKNQDCMDWSPRSVHVPRGKSVKVWDACQFKGQDATFTTGDVRCIEQIDFSFLETYGIVLGGKQNFLKKNAKPAENKVWIKELYVEE